MTPKKRTPRKKANETPTPRKRKRTTKDAAADEDMVNVNEENNLPADDKELLAEAESAIKMETGLEEIDPLLHPQNEEESPVVENGKNDPEWSEYNADAELDSDELSK